MKKAAVLILVLFVVVLGFFDVWPSPEKRAIQDVVSQASEIELVGLEPALIREPDPSLFGKRKVVQRRKLTPEETGRVKGALRGDFRLRVWVTARCFNPRHGLELTTPSGKQQLLLCYECNQMKLVQAEGVREPLVPLNGSSQEAVGGLLSGKP